MPNIHQAVLICAAHDKVFDALASEKGISGWWTPKATINAQLNSFARFHFGPTYYKEMKITELTPFELIKWHCTEGTDEWIGTNITFKLIPVTKENLINNYPEIQGQIEQQTNDAATLLIFNHDNWKSYTLMFAECSYTWGQFLKSLKLFCETGKGKPWPERHLNG